MLSRLALRSLQNIKPVSVVVRPTSTSASDLANSKTAVTTNEERDLVNFPRPVRAVEPAKVRLGFLPERWFANLYPKIGVTGPYTLVGGLVIFLYSKEYLIVDHNFFTMCTLFGTLIMGHRLFADAIANYLDKSNEEEEGAWVNYRNHSVGALKDGIESEKKAQMEAHGQEVLFNAKRENIALQLEAAYRERLATVHAEVKNKLDYQIETANVKNRIEQKHMVEWIVSSVKASITPAQEAAALKQCFADLKALAPAGA